MAESSPERNDDSNEEGADRFSALPDPIIQHIFSFLNADDIPYVSILAKRYGQACLTSPHLNFAYTEGYGHCSRKCQEFSTFVDKLMSQRGDHLIQSFKLRWTFHSQHGHSKESSRLHGWIQKAAKHNVEELNLNLESNERYPLWKPFFSLVSLADCVSLRFLELDLHNQVLELLPIVFPSLETMLLNSVKLQDSWSLGQWTECYCPSLRKLSLFPTNTRLTFKNQNIEDLTIKVVGDVETSLDISGKNLKFLSLHLMTTPMKDCSTKVFAPGLQVLMLEGNQIGETDFGLCTTLSNATFNIERANMWKLYDIAWFLRSVTSVKVLNLHICLAEDLSKRNQEPPLFTNLQHLSFILNSWENYHILVIDNFIRGLKNLKTLTVKREPNPRYPRLEGGTKWFEMNDSYHKKVIRRARNVPQVKEIKIRLGDYEDKDSVMKLVNYFVETVDGLEKITIFCSSYSSVDIILTELENVVSSTIIVVLLRK